ncbi:MAG: DUF1569 domain-containing protein [Bryobacteraceae bacterium]
MKPVLDIETARLLVERLHRVRPDSQGRWGEMTAHQMICHLSDSLEGIQGRKALGSKETFFSRTVVKYVALRAPMRWPKGVPTMPEMDAKIGGTPPQEWAADVSKLVALTEQFSKFGEQEFARCRHPMFGQMSLWEWKRWAYLHTDHHLRQFGV